MRIDLASVTVFRIAVLSLVLIFGIAPHATVLCGIWCHPSEATDVCDPPGASSTAIVSGDTTCAGVVANVSTFIREDGRTAAVSESGPSVVARHSPFGVMPAEARTIATGARASAIEAGPLLVILRL